MGVMVQQLQGFFLGLLGLIGTFTSTVIPQWRQTAYFSANFYTASLYMKGLWLECVSHTTGIYQCEVYRSMLALPKGLLAARVLMLFSCSLSTAAVIISAVGMKCTSFAQHSKAKDSLAVCGGMGFILAGLICLVPASWTTSDVIQGSRDLLSTGGIRYEIGLAVYMAFISGMFSIFGGCVLCLVSWDADNDLRRKTPNETPSSA